MACRMLQISIDRCQDVALIHSFPRISHQIKWLFHFFRHHLATFTFMGLAEWFWYDLRLRCIHWILNYQSLLEEFFYYLYLHLNIIYISRVEQMISNLFIFLEWRWWFQILFIFLEWSRWLTLGYLSLALSSEHHVSIFSSEETWPLWEQQQT